VRIRYSLAATVTALALATAAAACGSTTAKIGTGSTTVTGQQVRGGTVTVAEPSGASPNDVFPLAPSTNSNGYNVNLTMGEWPTLVYIGYGAASVINPQESLYSSLTWSDNDSVITIVLKPWKWSDGVPVTARDFTFVYNLLKANYNDWEDFIPGLFPADVTSVATPNSRTIVITLDRSYNPAFYTDNVLYYVPLLPQHAWDKTSAAGAVGNYDETTAGAKAVWTFLQAQGSDMATFTTNPLWQVVDGPWKLAQFLSDGYYAWVPNKSYSGSDKPVLSKVIFTPFTTDDAEMDTLRSGTSLTVADLPLNDVSQAGALEREGYAVTSVPTPGVAEIVPNFYNPVNGPVLRQLYVRQALEYLIDRQQITSDAFHGYADPGNGPIPVTYGQQWASPLEKAGGPYPYAPAKAIALLKAHGWSIVPNGTDTCQRPGTGASDCGAGVTAGEQLQFQLLYSSGSAYIDQQNAAIQTSEAQAGVHIILKAEPFNTLVATTSTCNAQSHPGSTCSWQLQNFGWQPYSLDPTGAGLFNTDAINNYGGYSSPQMNQLINETEYGSNPSAFYAYENYAAEQLPWLWLPNPSAVYVYKSNLAGFVPTSPFDFTLNPEVWYYVKPAS
jgi:peptide/nickel transport system substrate-binding protein